MSAWGRLGRHAAALAFYSLLALFFCRPIFGHFSTWLIGPGGDLSDTLWNIWHFRRSLSTHAANPWWTFYMFWPYGANLLLHQYTLFTDVLAFFMTPILGTEATYNLQLVASLILSAYAFMLMAVEWGASWPAALVSGALFAFSPVVSSIIDGGDGLSYQTYYPMILFVWAFSRAVKNGRLRDCAFAAAALTIQWTYCYYYFLFCCLLMPFFFLWLERPISAALSRRPPSPWTRLASRACELALAASLLWILQAARHGQREFHGQGSFRVLLAYLFPYLAFWASSGARLALAVAPAVCWNPAAFERRKLFPYAATIGCWAAMNAPLILAVLSTMRGGGYGGTPHAWRGGGMPVDVFWLVLPDFTHPLWGRRLERLYGLIGIGRPGTDSLGLIPLAAAFWLRRRRPEDKWISLWFAAFAFSFVITLGPWLKVLGLHTYLPLPFYFLHLLPVFSNLQHGLRFISFSALFLALLFAAFLDAVKARLPARLAPWVPAAAFCLLALENFPGARRLSRIEVPAVIRRLGQRPDGAMLTVPTGAIFNGITAKAGVGSIWPDIALQAVHQKPIVGGYLGRVPKRTYDAMVGDSFWQALISAQEGGALAPELSDSARVRSYLREMRLKYVLMNASRIPAPLRETVERWPIKKIDEEGSVTLYSAGS